MTYVLIALQEAQIGNSQLYNDIIKQWSQEYTGCDVLVTSPVHTSAQLASILLQIYSELRVHILDAGFDHEFDINVLFRPLDRNYAAKFKLAGHVVEGIDDGFIELHTNLENISKTDEGPLQSDSLKKADLNDIALVSESIDLGSASCVAVGGTFDHLHDGHKILLLLTALCAGSKIIVGVTGDELLKLKKYREFLEPLSVRMKSVCDFLQMIMSPRQRFEIYQINDICGPTGYIDHIDALVISQETRLGAEFVNARRGERGYRLLKVVCADVVGGEGNAENNWKGKLSSTDMRAMKAKRQKVT
ncbi:hypothetical protein PUMCH_001436 [Australozyma saopauloensis]|uniref:Cytidyltransferase-like domain-containing protein n=1 Tax=Australozyma saopauloensis TaxID=291208 RepID=A0AAX4H6L5_9ASCO|nr:hypothetical protein PUMCH_001436 [[Candida] saopauloensis]